MKMSLLLLCSFTTPFGHCFANQPNSDTGSSHRIEDLMRHTRCGDIVGYETNGIASWLGIPLARPPVGSLRWHAPRAPTPWTGVRQGLHYGFKCLQPAIDLPPIHGHLIHAAEYLKGVKYLGSETAYI